MTKNKLIVPKFTSEEADAAWHRRHRRTLEAAVERRIQEGSTLNRQQATARARTRLVTLRLPTAD